MLKKFLRPVLLGAVMAMTMSFSAFASDVYGDVTIRINEDKAEPGIVYPVDFDVSGNCDLSDISMSQDQSEWKAGKKVTITFEVTPEEGKSFSSSKTKVKVSNGELVSSSIKSQKLTAKVNYTPSVQLADPTNIYWGDGDEEYWAFWDEVEYATAYEVRVYVDGNRKEDVKVTKPKVDLRKYATDGNDVTFEVRACAKSDKDAKYLKASNWIDCDESVVADSSNTSVGNFNGNYDNYTFRDSNGQNVSGWQLINGLWFYFDPANNNKAVKDSWKMIDNKWYYFNSYCQMQIGWLSFGGQWYYLNPNGDMAAGWITVGPSGPWYYLDPVSGVMLTNTTTPDGYYVNEKGEWYP